MKNKLLHKNFIVIADWMLKLRLNARELLVYALIYGFSQNKESGFFGSLSYLSLWLGIEKHSENGLRYLKALEKNNLIKKEKIKLKNNQVQCVYKTNFALICDDDRDINYIIVQPWMISEMRLSGKDLLLYALIYGHDAYGKNTCFYDKEYLSKWLKCRKDNVSRQVDKLIKKNLICIKRKGKREIICVLKHSNSPQNESSFPQIESTLSQNESTFSLKLKDNNINNSINNNILDNNPNQGNTIKSLTADELFLIINRDIDLNVLDSCEKIIMHQKRLDDYTTYCTHGKAIDIVYYLNSWALIKLRILSAYRNDVKIKQSLDNAEKLVIEILVGDKLKNINFDNAKLQEFFIKAYEMIKTGERCEKAKKHVYSIIYNCIKK